MICDFDLLFEQRNLLRLVCLLPDFCGQGLKLERKDRLKLVDLGVVFGLVDGPPLVKFRRCLLCDCFCCLFVKFS